jgi:membrane protein DedA with SNARE-associated domain/rhodanese-related sulfurtransferase
MGYYLVHITYPILFLAVLARQLCLPVPAILFLLSAGALAGSGKLSFVGILIAAVAGSILADFVWFQAGRIGGKRILRLLCTFTQDPSYCIRRGQTTFQKRGARLLVIAKFFPGLDGVTPPLAGMLGTPATTFLFFDAIGASLWAGTYIGCGLFFAEELDKVARNISSFANAVVLIFGVPLLVFFVWKLLVLIRMIRFLREFRIPPEELKSRLDSGEKLGIIDLLRFEEDPEDVPGIPGAVRLDPLEIRRKKQVRVPDDVSLVLYCRSRDSFVSARVAAAMRRDGILKVQILAGGLEAWKALGLPLSAEFVDPKTLLNRLGIEVQPPWQPVPAKTR